MNDVDLFTDQSEISQTECDEYAQALTNNACVPLKWQGAHTYTLLSGSGSIIQFRGATEPMDESTLKLAKDIFGSYAPKATYHGLMPHSSVSVWTMERIPGVMKIAAVDNTTPDKQDATAADMGKFFAASWKKPLKPDPQRIDYYRSRLDLISAHSPVALQEIIEKIKQDLEAITTQLPWVLTHADLGDANTLVDEDTGHLTGVVDWAAVTIQPFGIALWGFEFMLGHIDNRGWNWIGDDPGSVRHRNLFRASFFAAIGERLSVEQCKVVEASRALGIVLRFGFEWSDGIESVRSDVYLINTFLDRSLFTVSEN